MLGRNVECRLTGEQNRDRLIGVCFLDGADLGETLVRAGHARDCPHFSAGRYIQAEVAARDTERDLSRVYPLPSYCLR
jgi:endonuclease YncB( thermonuclease family)